MQIPVVSDEKSLLFYFALLLIVAFIFSAAGLFVGIFTVHGKGGKRLFFELFRDSPRYKISFRVLFYVFVLGKWRQSI